MSGRPAHRNRGIKLGKLGNWPLDADLPDAVASRVTYSGDPVHKTYRSRNRAAAWRPGRDKTQCDSFDDTQWPDLQKLLEAAIRTEYVSEDFEGGFPKRAWAWVNGVLHEARLTNQENGGYHGFPIDNEAQYPEPRNRLRNAPHAEILIHSR